MRAWLWLFASSRRLYGTLAAAGAIAVLLASVVVSVRLDGLSAARDATPQRRPGVIAPGDEQFLDGPPEPTATVDSALPRADPRRAAVEAAQQWSEIGTTEVYDTAAVVARDGLVYVVHVETSRQIVEVVLLSDGVGYVVDSLKWL